LLISQKGCKEPLTAKFADGGNKKKVQHLSHRQWADKPAHEVWLPAVCLTYLCLIFIFYIILSSRFCLNYFCLLTISSVFKINTRRYDARRYCWIYVLHRFILMNLFRTYSQQYRLVEYTRHKNDMNYDIKMKEWSSVCLMNKIHSLTLDNEYQRFRFIWIPWNTKSCRSLKPSWNLIHQQINGCQ